MMKAKIPIIAASMNQVSDANLAIACQRAGILPSISFLNFIDKKTHNIDVKGFCDEVKKYNNETGSSQLLISISTKSLLFKSIRKTLKEIFKQINYSHLEIIPLGDVNFTHPDFEKNYKHRLDSLKEVLVELEVPFVYWKSVGLKGAIKVLEYCNFINGVILKGENGAGTTPKSYGNLEENINYVKKHFQNIEVVASGGINTYEEIKKYLNIGADKVAIGTPFAASLESKISHDSKMQLVKNNSLDLQRISEHQNGIMFKRLKEDDMNNTFSLQQGMISPQQGHLFAGKGIDYIDGIHTVNTIVEKLWPIK